MKPNGVAPSVSSSTTKSALLTAAWDTLKKFDVEVDKIIKEINLISFDMVDYEEKGRQSLFGEKESISYVIDFVAYNVHFNVKLLTFEYHNKRELLKLDIECKTPPLEKETRYCCNLLKRRRNLNLMFMTLITFARNFESRRLVCELVLKKNQFMRVEENESGGKIIIYHHSARQIKIGIFWNVECNSEHAVFDKIEVYYKVLDHSNKEDIVTVLKHLTNSVLKFNEKLHLWKHLLDSLARYNVKNTCTYCKQSIRVQQDISVIHPPQLIPDRKDIKMELDEEDEVTIISSPSLHRDPAEETNQKELAIILLNEDQLNNTVIVSSDNEDRRSKRTLSTDSQAIIEVDIVVPQKKPKSDDDLEITGVTYVIPD